ncbi:ROK family protein [Paraflavisolibacter sp. H34]|uniref:ROK family protein n=1 Tax=Huijunlia imazamoxiresistens TaxID=3127457 RepID=UPI003018F4C9
MNSFVIGVDIGGSHITAAVIDIEHRQILPHTICRRAVDATGAAASLIAGWSAAINKCRETIASLDIFIGIAMPGPFDYDNGISYIREQDKFKTLYGVNVKEALAESLEIPPAHIRFLNDAAAFLEGEVFSGAVGGHQSAFGITLGTGFGSAFYKDGEATDANLWCAPFKEGIAEDYFSTRWFLQQYTRKTGRQVSHVKELAQMYPQDWTVKVLFREFGENLASFLLETFSNELPQAVILGGNISRSFDYFYPFLQESLKKQMADVAVKKSTLYENASLLGAASCWSEQV